MNEFETLQKITELFAQLPAIERDYILTRLADDNRKLQADVPKRGRKPDLVVAVNSNGKEHGAA